MTAEKFLKKDKDYKKIIKDYPKLNEAIKLSMITFAQYHVKKALNEVSLNGNFNVNITFDKELIFDFYPITKIK